MTINVYIREESEFQYTGHIQYNDPEGSTKINYELTLLRPSSDIEALADFAPYDSRPGIVRDSIALVFTSTEHDGIVNDLGRVNSAQLDDKNLRGLLEEDVMCAYASLLSLKATSGGRVKEYTFKMLSDDDEDTSDWPINLDM